MDSSIVERSLFDQDRSSTATTTKFNRINDLIDDQISTELNTNELLANKLNDSSINSIIDNHINLVNDKIVEDNLPQDLIVENDLNENANQLADNLTNQSENKQANDKLIDDESNLIENSSRFELSNLDESTDQALNEKVIANQLANELSIELNKPKLCDPNKFEILNNPKYETTRMKDYMKKAVKATSQYNKLINQERKDERKICLDLQTYTLHYPLGLGAENRMLKRNIENGKCNQKNKYPIAVLPGHFQNQYRKYTSQELKYFPINTVIYGPVITDTDKLPPLLTRIEEDSFSDSDSNSVSTEHSCCCDEKSCKKLKLDNNNCENNQECNCNHNELSSSASDDDNNEEAEDDEQPPKLINVALHFQHRENAVCDQCKKNSIQKLDAPNEKLIHCTDCMLSFHPTCLEMTPEMIVEIDNYPWECNKCK